MTPHTLQSAIEDLCIGFAQLAPPTEPVRAAVPEPQHAQHAGPVRRTAAPASLSRTRFKRSTPCAPPGTPYCRAQRPSQYSPALRRPRALEVPADLPDVLLGAVRRAEERLASAGGALVQIAGAADVPVEESQWLVRPRG
ncbi:hypothetical protein BD413DRAFT_613279 [Trametes elegans]|nr:hypothetical protein BD413DRAFT_613279 [Trametes elegans]